MFKAAAAIGVASALHIDFFETPEKFTTPDMVKSLMKGPSARSGKNDLGVVTFSQCDDDAHVFTFDSTDTTYSPDPIVKGSDLSTDLWGTVTDSIEVTNVHVHVLWDDNVLYDEDLPGDDTYDSTYEQKITWTVPSYAPSGSYDVTITGTGTTEGSSSETLFCVKADFDL